MNWDRLQYNASEGSAFSVCAVQLGSSQRQFTTDISAALSDGVLTRSIATGNISYYIVTFSLDLSIEDMQLTFPPTGGSQTICTNVTIASDDLLEDEETFCLTLSSFEPNVIIGLNAEVTCIVIEDANSKCVCHLNV